MKGIGARGLPLPGDAGAGEASGAVVLGVAAVSGDLVPGDVVLLDQRDQGFPEVAVLHRLLLGVEPAVLAPALVPPVAEAVDHVRAVAVDGDPPPALEGAEALDRGG